MFNAKVGIRMPLTLTLNDNEKLIKTFTAGYYLHIKLNRLVVVVVIGGYNIELSYIKFEFRNNNNNKNESRNVFKSFI